MDPHNTLQLWNFFCWLSCWLIYLRLIFIFKINFLKFFALENIRKNKMQHFIIFKYWLSSTSLLCQVTSSHLYPLKSTIKCNMYTFPEPWNVSGIRNLIAIIKISSRVLGNCRFTFAFYCKRLLDVGRFITGFIYMKMF